MFNGCFHGMDKHQLLALVSCLVPCDKSTEEVRLGLKQDMECCEGLWGRALGCCQGDALRQFNSGGDTEGVGCRGMCQHSTAQHGAPGQQSRSQAPQQQRQHQLAERALGYWLGHELLACRGFCRRAMLSGACTVLHGSE